MRIKNLLFIACFSLFIFPLNINAISSVYSSYENNETYNQNISSINYNTEFETEPEKIKINGIKNLAVNNTEEIVYIYKEPSVKSEILAILPPNGVCDIIEEKNVLSLDSFLNNQNLEKFILIKSGDYEGYIKSEYITVDNLEEYLEIETYGQILSDAECKLFPKHELDTIYTIPKDTIIEIFGYSKDNQWVYTEYHGNKYYIKSSLVDIKTFVDYAYEYEKSSVYKSPNLNYLTEAEFHESFLEFVLQFEGNKYVWGGTSLVTGADCSGFTQAIYRQFGYNIDRSARTQFDDGIKVTADELLPGDLIFYGTYENVSHVGIYIGDGKMIHASNSAPYPKGGVKISNYDYREPLGFSRIVEF